MYYVGKIVNTHGIKGEVKIISNIKNKDLVFKKGNELIVDTEKLIINSYRVHKNFDMVTFNNITNINDVLKYKGKKVYFDKKDLDILFYEDYIGMEVYTKNFVGKVTDIISNGVQDILVIKNDKKKYYIPNIDVFVKIENNKIYINEIEGLLNDN